jgi:predicted small secreted protein
MTRSLAALLAIAACLALSACNTVRGAGHDIESVANTVDNAM